MLPISDEIVNIWVVWEKTGPWVPHHFTKKVVIAEDSPFSEPSLDMDDIEDCRPSSIMMDAGFTEEEVLWSDLSEDEKLMASALDTFARDDNGHSYYYRPVRVSREERLQELYHKALHAPLKGQHELCWYPPRVRGA